MAPDMCAARSPSQRHAHAERENPFLVGGSAISARFSVNAMATRPHRNSAPAGCEAANTRPPSPPTASTPLWSGREPCANAGRTRGSTCPVQSSAARPAEARQYLGTQRANPPRRVPDAPREHAWGSDFARSAIPGDNAARHEAKPYPQAAKRGPPRATPEFRDSSRPILVLIRVSGVQHPVPASDRAS